LIQGEGVSQSIRNPYDRLYSIPVLSHLVVTTRIEVFPPKLTFISCSRAE
jgi:hypothetical protein